MRHVKMESDAVLAQLEKGRKYLDSARNWCQGNYVRDGKLCISAACSPTHNRMALNNDVRQALMESVRRLFPTVYASRYTITGFNDRPDRTHADIIAVLDDAINERKKCAA